MEQYLPYILSLVIFFLSVAFHEYAHGWMANQLGDDTAEREGRLTLNPIAHIDPFWTILFPFLLIIAGSPFVVGAAKPVPYNPYNLRDQRWGEAKVALAGPVSNFLIAVIMALILRFAAPALGNFSTMALDFYGILVYVGIINILLALFNLIPVPPMDGSKVLAAILPGAGQRLVRYLESFGIITVIIFMLFFYRYIGVLVEWSQNIFAGLAGL